MDMEMTNDKIKKTKRKLSSVSHADDAGQQETQNTKDLRPVWTDDEHTAARKRYLRR